MIIINNPFDSEINEYTYELPNDIVTLSRQSIDIGSQSMILLCQGVAIMSRNTHLQLIVIGQHKIGMVINRVTVLSNFTQKIGSC